MNPGPDAAQWYANDIAVAALIVTCVGLAINAVIAYYAVSQTKAARAAAETAKESVRVAQESIEQAKGALEVSNRAWIHVNRIIPHESTPDEVAQNKQISITPDVVLKNFGTTPAVALRAECRIAVFPHFPTLEEIEFNLADQAERSVVSPDMESWVRTVYQRFTLDEWTTLTRGNQKLVLYGKVHYDDIFGKSHQSTWLYWWDMQRGGFFAGSFYNDAT